MVFGQVKALYIVWRMTYRYNSLSSAWGVKALSIYISIYGVYIAMTDNGKPVELIRRLSSIGRALQ